MSSNSTPHEATARCKPLLPLTPTLVFAERTKLRHILCNVVELTLMLNGLYEQAEQLGVVDDEELALALAQLDKAFEDAIAQGMKLESAYPVQSRDGTIYTLTLTELGVECRKVS